MFEHTKRQTNRQKGVFEHTKGKTNGQKDTFEHTYVILALDPFNEL